MEANADVIMLNLMISTHALYDHPAISWYPGMGFTLKVNGQWYGNFTNREIRPWSTPRLTSTMTHWSFGASLSNPANSSSDVLPI